MLRLVTNNSAKRIISYVVSMVLIISMIQMIVIPTQVVCAADEFETSIADFPESYKPYLRELHSKYPQWTFKAYKTGIDFATAVANEQTQGKSVMEKSYNDFLKSRSSSDYNASTGTYVIRDGSTWISASKNTIAYFMDPRNFLNENFIAMFELLSYDSTTQTREGVEAILKGSFMYKTNVAYFNSNGVYKTTTGDKYLYSQRFIDAAIKSKVSPYYLASKSVLEVGGSSYNASKYPGVGAGNSVNGLYSGYKGIFNFYNIGASDGTNAVAKGLAWASTPDEKEKYERPWNTPGKSIVGGAVYIGEKYINAGQDTTYFQRFNVKSGLYYKPYTHQYMTSIYGNAAESNSTMKAYKSINIMETAKTFVIPVYENMPGDNTTITYGNEKKTGVINANVNMRAGASTSNDIVVKLSTSDKVTVLEGVMTSVEYSVKWLNNPYWYKIYVVKNGIPYTGYVSANYVDLNSEKTIIKGVATQIPMTLSQSETVFYESDNPAIATVDSEGKVKGVKTGTTTIRAYTANGNFGACTVTVSDKGVVLSESSISMDRKATHKLTTTIYPDSLSNKKLIWKSDNTNVATVSADGKITAKAVGTTTIHCQLEAGGVEATCTVTVIEPVKGVSLNKTSATVSMGETITLNATVSPDNATIKGVSWSSNNKAVATVKKGVITPVSQGKATITVKTKNNAKTATCVVKVVPGTTALTVKPRGYNNVKLTWTAVDGVTGYKIYRRTPNGKYKLILTTKDTKVSYIDTGLSTGKTYEYSVCGYTIVDSVQYVAKKSEMSSVTVIPAKPSSVKVEKYQNKAALIKWKKVNGATGYEIYRKEGKNGTYKKIKTIKVATLSSYKNTRVKTGVTYYYKVRAYTTTKKENIYSKYSNVASIKW